MDVAGRSLRGNVDRNAFRYSDWTRLYYVVPYVGTWIEIKKAGLNPILSVKSFPTWERG